MTHQHHQEEEKKDDYVYYLVGILSGLFVGVILESSFIWIPILGVFGLLFTAFFKAVFVKGRGNA
jgi:hypothetical protein